MLVGEDVEVSDGNAMLRRLQAITGDLSADTYADDEATIRLASIRAPSEDDLRDPETARQTLALTRRRLEEELQRLKVAEDVSRAKLELNAKEKEYAGVRARLAEHDRYLASWKDRPIIQSRLDTLNASLTEANAALRELASEGTRLGAKASALANDKTSVAALTNNLATTLQKVQLGVHGCSSPGGRSTPSGFY